MSFKFKSTGVKNKVVVTNTTPTFYGVKFPMEIDSKYSFLKINIDPLDQITDDLKNLILTNHGERLGRYTYGANLRPLLSEISVNQSFEDSASQRILNAVSTWMPFISLLDLTTNVSNESTTGLAVLEMKVVFSVPEIREEIRTLNFMIKLLG